MSAAPFRSHDEKGTAEMHRCVQHDRPLSHRHFSTGHTEHFSKQLPHSFPGHAERLSAERCYCVNPLCNFTVALLVGAQITLALQTVENRIKCAGAELVAVPPQFLSDPNSVKRLLGGVVKNMQTDQP